MRIGFITSCLCFGGAEKMLCWVASELENQGHSSVIFNLEQNINNVDYVRPVNDSINIVSVKAHGIKGLKRIKQIFELSEAAKKEKIDIIIGFTTYPNFLAVLCGKLNNIPSIVCERCDPETELKSVLCRFYHIVINKADGGVFQIEGAKKFYSKKLQKKSEVIPNPIFLNETIITEKTLPPDKSIISVGRLDNFQKRYDVMIKAFELFHSWHPEYTLKIYGAGADENMIKELANNSSCSEAILFLGLTNEPMIRMAENEIFLITSDFEGISNSLLEAMAVGMPVISTDCKPGGSRMLIQDGTNGQLVPRGDVSAIACALKKYAENNEYLQKCGKNAVDVRRRFAPNLIIEKWESYIKRVHVEY